MPPDATAVAVIPTAPIRTADELAAAFLVGYAIDATRTAYARDLNSWGAWLQAHGIGVLEARRAHVDLWMREAEAAGRAPATVARALAAVSGLYSYALAEGLIARSPVAPLRR